MTNNSDNDVYPHDAPTPDPDSADELALTSLNLTAVQGHLDAALQAEPGPDWQTAVFELAADVPLLLSEVRLQRRRRADLVAAGRAALTALADGEADPWWYLRDVLPPAPPDHPLHRPDRRACPGRGWCR